MMFVSDWKHLEPVHRRVVLAGFLGWALDAFDFFLLIFVLKDVATTFHASMTEVTLAIFLTLATRPVGALFFGVLSDRYGRRPVLMAVVMAYSVFGFLSALAPSLALFFLLRAFFGIAMGGEWGAGSSLVMESVPPPARGFVSGILQAGYPSGYLLASLAYAFVYPMTGWRGLMMLALLPAFLVLYIRKNIPESHVVEKGARAFPDFRKIFLNHWKTVIFAIFLMTAFNFLSHGTQDLYPSFLERVHHLSPREVGGIAVLYNIGAILGGMTLSTLSERMGRRRAIFMAAVLALCCTPFWGSSHGTLIIAVSAFLMQFFVQGAWGVVPVYLNEISPSAIRGVFPGLVYQFGNLLASANATIQSAFSVRLGGRLDMALMAVAGLSAFLIALLIMTGPEKRGEVLEK